MPSAGRSSSATGTSTPRRPTGTRRASAQGLRESGVPREEIFVTTKFFPRRKDPVAAARGEPSPARPRLRRPLHHPLAGRRPDLGVAGDGARARSRATRGRSASPTSASTSSTRCSRARRSRRSWTRCSSARTSTARRCSKPVPRERDRARGVQPARDRPPPRERRRWRRSRERHERTPAQVLLRWGISTASR